MRDKPGLDVVESVNSWECPDQAEVAVAVEVEVENVHTPQVNRARDIMRKGPRQPLGMYIDT